MEDLKCLPHRSELLQFYRSVLFALVDLRTLLVSDLHKKGITKSALLRMCDKELDCLDLHTIDGCRTVKQQRSVSLMGALCLPASDRQLRNQGLRL